MCVCVLIWPVSSHTNVLTGHTGTNTPKFVPLAGDDRPLTLLKRGCANSGGFGARRAGLNRG